MNGVELILSLLSIAFSSGLVVVVVNYFKDHFESAHAHYFLTVGVALAFAAWNVVMAFHGNPAMFGESFLSIAFGSQTIFFGVKALLAKKGAVTQGDVNKVEEEIVNQEKQINEEAQAAAA